MSDVDIDFFERVGSEIDAGNIEVEMRRVPADLAYANARFASAHRRYLLARFEYEHARARLFFESRQALVDEGVTGGRGAPTETAIESRVILHPDYRVARLAVIDADADRELWAGKAKALAGRREMLVSIGQRINAELRGDPIAAAQARNDRGMAATSTGTPPTGVSSPLGSFG